LDEKAPAPFLLGLFRLNKLVMDGQLAQVCLPSHFLPELVSPVENSSPEVVELRAEVHRLQAENLGMVQKHPFSGNTRDLSADPDRSRVGAGLRESLAAVLGLQFRENRVYPRSSSQ